MNDFYGPNYLENITHLYQTAGSIRQSEEQEFEDKWGKLRIQVPVTYINFEELKNDIDEKWPSVLGFHDEQVKVSKELVSLVGGPVAEALADWVNMTRRLHYRQTLTAYSTLGYLDTFMNEDGTVEYEVSHTADIDLPTRERVIESVVSYNRFSQRGK